MKLRNKKTGKIVVEVNKIGLVWNRFGMPAEIGQYDSIAELNEEWEDYQPTDGVETMKLAVIQLGKEQLDVLMEFAETRSIRLAIDIVDSIMDDLGISNRKDK